MAKKKYLIIGIVLPMLILIAGLYYFFGSKINVSKVYEGEVVIIMREDDYYPNTIKVRRGTKVEFKNESEYGTWPASDLHPSHGIYSEFDSKGVVKPGESWSFQFEQVGTWGMHDHLAPYIVGKIEVVE